MDDLQKSTTLATYNAIVNISLKSYCFNGPTSTLLTLSRAIIGRSTYELDLSGTRSSKVSATPVSAKKEKKKFMYRRVGLIHLGVVIHSHMK